VNIKSAESRWLLTRRHFLTGVAAAGGASLVYEAMTGLGLLAAPTQAPFDLTGRVSGVRVLILGAGLAGMTAAYELGKVGYDYARRLNEAGAELIVTDMYPPAITRAVEDLGAKAVEPNDIYSIDCDVFAPCALGAVLNEETIPQLRCSAIVGSANNQLREPEDADRIAELGILYAPDFVVNAGGVINVAVELGGYDLKRARKRIDGIYDTLLGVLRAAERESLLPNQAALALARRRIDEARSAGS